MAINKIHRLYSSEIGNLSRNLKDIKLNIESSEKLLKSEVKLMENNTILRMKEEMLTLAANKNNEIRKIKETI